MEKAAKEERDTIDEKKLEKQIKKESKSGVTRPWRWLVYALIGVVFGIIDYYIQLITVGFHGIFAFVAYIIVAFGIWLIPVLPIAIYEIKTSGSKLYTMFSCVLTWVVAVFVYYAYIMFRLMFVGQESMMYYHISNSADISYWTNVKNMFYGNVLGRWEWFFVAIIGGITVGFLVAIIYKTSRKNRYCQ